MAVIHYNGDYKPFAQQLRREMTKQEKHLWYDYLCHLPVRFRRQKQFGNYIVDFYCSSAKIVIELDGSQHFQDDGPERDYVRDSYLKSLGLKIIRIPNISIDQHFDDVCRDLTSELGL